jgi:transposase
MAQQLGIGRMTVVRSLQAPTFPERQGHTNLGKSVLTPYKERLLKRWNAGCREALQLFRDLRRHGYTGSYPTVARDAQRLRQAQGLRPCEPCAALAALSASRIGGAPARNRVLWLH